MSGLNQVKKTEIKHSASVGTKTLLLAITMLSLFSASMFIATLIKGIESFSQKTVSDKVEFRNIN